MGSLTADGDARHTNTGATPGGGGGEVGGGSGSDEGGYQGARGLPPDFIEDLERQELAPRIAKLRRALLIFHAPLDPVVSVDEASTIFAAAKHPKSFVSLDDADHLLTKARDAEYVAATISAWATRYIAEPENIEKKANHFL